MSSNMKNQCNFSVSMVDDFGGIHPMRIFVNTFTNEDTKRKKDLELRRFFDVESLEEIQFSEVVKHNPLTVQEWFLKNSSNYSQSSLNGTRITISQFYEWISGFDVGINRNPAKQINISSQKGRPKQYGLITHEEMCKLIKDEKVEPSDQVLYESLYRTGLRISEMLSVTLDMGVMVEENVWKFTVKVKGNSDSYRDIYISNDLYEKWKILAESNKKDRKLHLKHRRIFPYCRKTAQKKHLGEFKNGVLVKKGYFHTVLGLTQEQIEARNIKTHSTRSATSIASMELYDGNAYRAKLSTGHKNTDVYLQYTHGTEMFKEHLSLLLEI